VAVGGTIGFASTKRGGGGEMKCRGDRGKADGCASETKAVPQKRASHETQRGGKGQIRGHSNEKSKKMIFDHPPEDQVSADERSDKMK